MEKVDVILASALGSQEQWEELTAYIDEHLTVHIRGLRHPLGGQFVAAENKGRWFFFLPYHPVFAMALHALLLQPFLFRMSGDPAGRLSFRDGRLLEEAQVEVADDDIWIGEETRSRDFAKLPELRLLKQVSKASMATLTQGNCLAIPRSTAPRLMPGDHVTILRY